MVPTLFDLACTIYTLKRAKRTFRLVSHRSWRRLSWIFEDDDNAPVPCIDTSVPAFQKALADGHDLIVYPGGILETIGGGGSVADCRYQTSWQGKGRVGELAISQDTYVVPFFVQNQEDIYFKPMASLTLHLWRTFGVFAGVPLGIGPIPFPLELALHVGEPFCTRTMQPQEVIDTARVGIDTLVHTHQRVTRSKLQDIMQALHLPTAGSLLLLQSLVLVYCWSH